MGWFYSFVAQSIGTMDSNVGDVAGEVCVEIDSIPVGRVRAHVPAVDIARAVVLHPAALAIVAIVVGRLHLQQ